MRNQSGVAIESTCAFSRQVLLAGGVLLQEKEDERDDQQDCDRQHAERCIAGDRRGRGHREGADDRSGLRKETIVRPGNPWNHWEIMVAMHAIDTCC